MYAVYCTRNLSLRHTVMTVSNFDIDSVMTVNNFDIDSMMTVS
jgi:hypothetical protein